MKFPALALLLCLLALPCPAQPDQPTSQTDLALRLLRRTEVEENSAISPVSLQTAFAMAAAGARGQTRQEIVNGLVLGQDFVKTTKALLDSLRSDGAEVLIANRLWPTQSLRLNPNYLTLSDQAFGARPESLNFANSDAARKTINAWVAQHTKDKIPELLKPNQVDATTELVLTNALYFKGAWRSPFDKAQTSKADFHAPESTFSVPMMSQVGTFGYYEDEALQALTMDYSGSTLFMTIVVPRKADGWRALRDSLTPEMLQTIFTAPEEKVLARLPRFAVRSNLNVIPAMRSLGIDKAFGSADFSDMAQGLRISDAMHEAVVEVNEEGTVAAAATAVMSTRSMSIPKQILADHPFLFTISDGKTGAVLFVGQVVAPEKS